MSEPEILLKGGNTSTVVRIGDTVRRTTRPSSATVHRLLIYLEQQGYTAAPAFLGIDEKEREILSYLHGHCAISAGAWSSDELIESTARSLKVFHDITSRFPRSTDDHWAFTYPDESRHEVICHNDFGLYNMVTDNNRFKGIIDFDLAGPGPRLRDIAYAAYWLTPLSQNAEDMRPFARADIANDCHRLKLFCSGYGIEMSNVFTDALLNMVSEVLHHMASKDEMTRLFGNDVARQLVNDGHLLHWQQEAQAFDRHRTDIELACHESG